MLQTINNKIRQGFSDSAKQYDLYSSLHREIAGELLSQVSHEMVPLALLDIGCGTGYLTVKAKERFSKSRIIGLDFAKGMLEVARSKRDDISWVLADGNHLPFSNRSFDIVISNLAYQWAQDLSRAFSESRRVLITGGVLACTLFGYNTCQELFQSLSEASQGAVQFVRLPDEVKAHEALIVAGFKDPKVEQKQIKMEFKDMHELLTWFKAIGAPHLPREGYVGKETIARAAAIYRDRFSTPNGVTATFEVIRVHAKK